MTSKNLTLQKVWHEFERKNGRLPSTTREAADWGVKIGKLTMPDVDPLGILADDMAKALREEYGTDKEGRRYRVNHAVRVTRGGVQHTFWGVMGFAPIEHMAKAFSQRREQIVGDCLQLRVDVDAYNAMNKEQPPLQLVLDFTDDITERMYWKKDAA